MTLDAFTADAIGVTGTALAFGWALHWELREQHLQRVLQQIRIRFHAVGEGHREWPGWFEWAPLQPPVQPTATDVHEEWLDSLTEEDRHNLAVLGHYWNPSKLEEAAA